MENGIMVASAAAEGHHGDMIIKFGEAGILGDIGITSQMVTMWVISLILIGLSIFISRTLKKENPGKFQVFVEWAIGSLTNFFKGILGEERGNKFVPLLGTYFIFILICNYSGLLPFSGYLPGYKAPTSSLSVTAGLSLIVFVVLIGAGIKYKGTGFFKHFLTPMAFMLPLNILEELVRPVSLSLRLYGNIYGEEEVAHTLFGLCPFIVPAIMMFMSVLFCLIQALVFSLLTAVYLDMTTSTEH